MFSANSPDWNNSVAPTIPAIPEPAPNTARPVPIPVIAAKNTVLSANKSMLPPSASLMDNRVSTFCLIPSAKLPPVNKSSADDIPPTAEPNPKTARPSATPVIAAANVTPSINRAALPPNSSLIDSRVITLCLIPSAQSP